MTSAQQSQGFEKDDTAQTDGETCDQFYKSSWKRRLIMAVDNEKKTQKDKDVPFPLQPWLWKMISNIINEMNRVPMLSVW